MNCENIMENFISAYNKLLLDKNEDDYVNKISGLSATPFVIMNILKIKKIKMLICNLLENNLKYSYKITLFLYVKSDLFNKIIESSRINKKIKSIINEKCTINNTENSLEITISISKILRECVAYMDSFKILPLSIKNNDNPTENCSEKYNNTKFDDLWYNETKIEIVNRLKQMAQFFGIYVLSVFGIKRKRYEIILNMDYKTLAKYYNKCVLKIKKYLTEHLCYCEAYIEIEKNYIMSLFTHNDSLLSGTFDLTINTE